MVWYEQAEQMTSRYLSVSQLIFVSLGLDHLTCLGVMKHIAIVNWIMAVLDNDLYND